jgi:hypothetical protein
LSFGEKLRSRSLNKVLSVISLTASAPKTSGAMAGRPYYLWQNKNERKISPYVIERGYKFFILPSF